MRIVAGHFKGRTLLGPTGAGVRPTSDGLRETLFNVIGGRAEGARVLDGFAGTGAVGLEALSRGAAHATFVERDRRTVAVIVQNIAACGAEGSSRVVQDDVVGLAERRRDLGLFDIVFLDPPYDDAHLDEIVAEGARWVAPEGLLIVEHSRRRSAPEAAGAFVRYRVLTAGDSALSFYAAGRAG